MITEGRLYTVQDVADLLLVDVDNVRRWLETGMLRSCSPSGRRTLRVSGPDLADFIRGTPKELDQITG